MGLENLSSLERFKEIVIGEGSFSCEFGDGLLIDFYSEIPLFFSQNNFLKKVETKNFFGALENIENFFKFHSEYYISKSFFEGVYKFNFRNSYEKHKAYLKQKSSSGERISSVYVLFRKF